MVVLVGAVLLVLVIYLTLVKNRDPSVFHYSPADVVYAVPLHASHMAEQESQFVQPASGSENPKIVLPSSYFDFGTVAAGQVVKKTIPIANHGISPLVISGAHTTCGCTTADFTATEIPPGKVVLVIISFDAGYHDLRGQTVRRGVVVETNDPQNPVASIWFQATIR